MTHPRHYARRRIEAEMHIARTRIALQEQCFGRAYTDDLRWLGRLQLEHRLTFTRFERFCAWILSFGGLRRHG